MGADIPVETVAIKAGVGDKWRGVAVGTIALEPVPVVELVQASGTISPNENSVRNKYFILKPPSTWKQLRSLDVLGLFLVTG